MRSVRQNGEIDGMASLAAFETKVLEPAEEKALLRELAQCKSQLAQALAKAPGSQMPADDPQALANYIARELSEDSLMQAELGAVYYKYVELRSKLALANMRLVAHVAKRFRDRGVSYSDLLQEGFCGLLEAIDRFDLAHGTKLATYATWWIRQAMQRAVAATAYPVRLSPRHLRQLARNQEEIERGGQPRTRKKASDEESVSPEMIQRIHAATRPTVSLDATVDSDSSFSLLHTMSDPEGDRTGEVDMDETIVKLMENLRPREIQVLSLRFGLNGATRHSLSQVGKVLDVSKERVRQIQDRALEKLRLCVQETSLAETLIPS
ncbi:RNA polymerase, sigma 32 subunit, RpoH [Isosphaera pallida ATCC 43644]|jgi:RNA polymerase primary sigma factor|uniref:RNA polymerase, sigma 32 subunit, RpoH n=1 Tax=Isosphaera pallida (strain ATCC 43644 / DSM 9630 / IS1B) TaxID=575540 RepID=E8QXT6_ISOPI|nr:sigma-70 family RNA polymerase sigma factor [Isosphaera pallida]ADV64123.1 RNA polymerase, sigma 32 subunit, RpoH [Isosphaera pallida ATCC 43644]